MELAAHPHLPTYPSNSCGYKNHGIAETEEVNSLLAYRWARGHRLREEPIYLTVGKHGGQTQIFMYSCGERRCHGEQMGDGVADVTIYDSMIGTLVRDMRRELEQC